MVLLGESTADWIAVLPKHHSQLHLTQFWIQMAWRQDPLLVFQSEWVLLTHWGRVTHICVSKLTIIGSDNGLSPGRRQAIIWTNHGILLLGPLGIHFSEILIGIRTFSFRKCTWKCRLRNGVYFVSVSMCFNTQCHSFETTTRSYDKTSFSFVNRTPNCIYIQISEAYLSIYKMII